MIRRMVIAALLTFCIVLPQSYLLDGRLLAAPAANSVDPWPANLYSRRIKVANATIEIIFAPGRLRLTRAETIGWIKNCAHAIADYYGRYPVDHLTLFIMPVDGYGIANGTAYGYHGALIRLGLGRQSTQADLDSDWVLVHEMVHLAFPSMVDRYLWLEEGLATYVEPLARLNAGPLARTEVWWWLVHGLPKGLPASGDRGLDRTHTWGRTYWGGALFCLLVDIKIRTRTNNQHGLQDALRAVNAAGGNITHYWSIARALKIADEAVGGHVFTKLYNKMSAAPYQVDLVSLWRRLGVRSSGEHIRFDNSAPLAYIRRAITDSPGRKMLGVRASPRVPGKLLLGIAQPAADP